MDGVQMNKKIRLGIIGCGIAANDLHWPALKALQNSFTITAVCNHTTDKAERFAMLVGEEYSMVIPTFLDYKELIALETIDAVAVILPIELNLKVC
jgi:predicted dehydrogenase